MADLYAYQRRVDALIKQGKSVILQAPTGAGKTRAALFPFLAGWRDPDSAALPRQCLYVVPMRVLANQFHAEYKQTVQSYSTNFGLRDVRGVAIQTGDRPDDRKFEADLIFTTVDQFLSSFLTIPYSLSNRQANLNAGAIIGSYLVFDEFHLFPVDDHGNGALATTLHVLQMLKGITPFVLMTATFSERMVQHLCRELDAEPVVLTQDEIDAIPSQQGKQRRYVYTGQELQAQSIIGDFVKQDRGSNGPLGSKGKEASVKIETVSMTGGSSGGARSKGKESSVKIETSRRAGSSTTPTMVRKVGNLR